MTVELTPEAVAKMLDRLDADGVEQHPTWQREQEFIAWAREAVPAIAARLAEVEYLVAVTGDYADKERRRAEAADEKNRELTMQLLAALGQAQEAYEAQKKAEALSWRLRSYAVHDDDCTRNRHPHYRGCSCGLQKLLDGMAEQTAPDVGAVNKGEE